MSSILEKSKFWYSFVAFIIISLFIYGLILDNEDSLLKKYKKENAQFLIDIKNANEIISSKENSISNLNQELDRKDVIINERNNAIENLNERIETLNDEINALYDRLNPYHQYGKDKGKLTIYTSCSDGVKTKVYIDGDYVGLLDEYFPSGFPNCEYSKTGSVISKIVLSGSHHIKAEDVQKRTWDFYVIVLEDQCNRQGLTCK
ncbi:MAG TPA: hypothetical protein DCR43_05585 [Bacteroidales bacterium]|nr:MAG: hypothetical protein A2X11_12265 [Bacteroidetes bacterium GWE2_42_24]OFY32460.1 MAG: hypothetical protein A2X09_08010 [Bacteroidetes bacterium GWF2_43_11]HAQ65306.1 hypothetical protein [Bacteroidales bacterium]HBZ65421.1 hypothetical protein [Bacteroidales bacterium]